MKTEAADTLRNWATNLRYFVCRRSNEIGGAFLALSFIGLIYIVHFLLEGGGQ